MNDEASSSTVQPQHEDNTTSDTEHATENETAEGARKQEVAEQRSIRAKGKRLKFLETLLRELDMIIFLELITIYYLDCSFFWFFVRAIIHLVLLTPLPDFRVMPPRDEQRAFLPMILAPFIICFILHLTFARPSAGEDTRGYLHGGLMIDFIGQQGPTPKLHLAALDICVLGLQLVMLSVHVKRRKLRRNLPSTPGLGTAEEATHAGGSAEAIPPVTNPDQDADAEERGVLRRADTISVAGGEPDEEDELLPSASSEGSSSRSSAHRTDLLDALTAGQVVVANLYVVDTLLQEHESYQAFLQTRSSGVVNSSGASPGSGGLVAALPGARFGATIRMRLGGG